MLWSRGRSRIAARSTLPRRASARSDHRLRRGTRATSAPDSPQHPRRWPIEAAVSAREADGAHPRCGPDARDRADPANAWSCSATTTSSSRHGQLLHANLVTTRACCSASRRLRQHLPFEGQASVFATRTGVLPLPLPRAAAPGLGAKLRRGGVLGVLPGVIGTIQETETISCCSRRHQLAGAAAVRRLDDAVPRAQAAPRSGVARSAANHPTARAHRLRPVLRHLAAATTAAAPAPLPPGSRRRSRLTALRASEAVLPLDVREPRNSRSAASGLDAHSLDNSRRESVRSRPTRRRSSCTASRTRAAPRRCACSASAAFRRATSRAASWRGSIASIRRWRNIEKASGFQLPAKA